MIKLLCTEALGSSGVGIFAISLEILLKRETECSISFPIEMRLTRRVFVVSVDLRCVYCRNCSNQAAGVFSSPRTWQCIHFSVSDCYATLQTSYKCLRKHGITVGRKTIL